MEGCYVVADASTNNTTDNANNVSDAERYVIAALIATAGALGITGNSVVILAILLNQKLIRSPTNIFVLNLCVSDWITCVNIPWVVIAMVNSENEWPLPDWICSWCGFNLIACVGCSTFTLAFIAVNRLFIITYSTIYRKLYTPFKIALMVFFAWLLPITLATIPLVSEFGDLGYDYKYRTCTWDTANLHSDSYSLLLALAYTPIQAAVIIFSYAKIFVHIWSHSKKLHPASSVSDDRSQSGQELSDSPTDSRLSDAAAPTAPATALQERLYKRQVQVTRNMFYVVCGFMICLVPFGVSLMVPGLNSERFVFYAAVSLVSSSVINPIIYATKHPEFRGSMLRIVKCNYGKL